MTSRPARLKLNSPSRSVSSYLAGAVTDRSKVQILEDGVAADDRRVQHHLAALEISFVGSDKHFTGPHIFDSGGWQLHIVSVS